jgi:hypothetical protein
MRTGREQPIFDQIDQSVLTVQSVDPTCDVYGRALSRQRPCRLRPRRDGPKRDDLVPVFLEPDTHGGMHRIGLVGAQSDPHPTSLGCPGTMVWCSCRRWLLEEEPCVWRVVHREQPIGDVKRHRWRDCARSHRPAEPRPGPQC